MLWVMFCRGSLAPALHVDFTLTSASYLMTMKTYHLPVQVHHFMQTVFLDDSGPLQENNEPHHTAKQFQMFQKCKFKVWTWTSNFPDLNPIECVVGKTSPIYEGLNLGLTAFKESVADGLGPDTTSYLQEGQWSSCLICFVAKEGKLRNIRQLWSLYYD